ncbi:Bacitracin export ATP-binding protein BceA [Pirellula sp. SH-Sr6A]|nr:Bacitracin export ATP-binding protein BceA [Pirellula sp. SH-Sr6A]
MSDSKPVQVSNVVKRFRQGRSAVTALDGVSVEIVSGEFVAIMGASGSGKSTLLHAMAGLTEIDEGIVRVGGQDLAQLNDRQLTQFRRRKIGLIFQSFNLIPSLSAVNNILLPANSDQETINRSEQLLDRLGISPRRNHKPGAMSGGEQQRVAIARALITEPAIVFADEPTGSLDSTTGQKLCELLRELCDEEHRSIVVVTHEPTVAMWADRVLVLRDGKLLTEFATTGSHHPHEITERYQQALFGESLV